MADNHQHVWSVTGGMFGLKNDYKMNLHNEIIQISSNNNSQNEFAIDCMITEKLFYENYKDSYIQHYRDGKKIRQ